MNIFTIAQNTTTLLLPIVLVLFLVFIIVGIVLFIKLSKVADKINDITTNVKETTFLLTNSFTNSLMWVWDAIGSFFAWLTKKKERRSSKF